MRLFLSATLLFLSVQMSWSDTKQEIIDKHIAKLMEKSAQFQATPEYRVRVNLFRVGQIQSLLKKCNRFGRYDDQLKFLVQKEAQLETIVQRNADSFPDGGRFVQGYIPAGTHDCFPRRHNIAPALEFVNAWMSTAPSGCFWAASSTKWRRVIHE